MADIFPFAEPEFTLLQLVTTASCLSCHCAPLSRVQLHLLHSCPTDSWSQLDFSLSLPFSAKTQPALAAFPWYGMCFRSNHLSGPQLCSFLSWGPQSRKRKAEQENPFSQSAGYILAHTAQPSVSFCGYKVMLSSPIYCPLGSPGLPCKNPVSIQFGSRGATGSVKTPATIKVSKALHSPNAYTTLPPSFHDTDMALFAHGKSMLCCSQSPS